MIKWLVSLSCLFFFFLRVASEPEKGMKKKKQQQQQQQSPQSVQPPSSAKLQPVTRSAERAAAREDGKDEFFICMSRQLNMLFKKGLKHKDCTHDLEIKKKK